jgi:hypothetical protein
MQKTNAKSSASSEELNPALLNAVSKMKNAALNPNNVGNFSDLTTTTNPDDISPGLQTETLVKPPDNFIIQDEFTSYDPLREEDSALTHGLRPRGQRRLGKTKRKNTLFEDYTEEDVWNFLGFIDGLWRRLAETVEEVVDEFENWNKWFKKEKKLPPSPESNKVIYIREEFNTKRSPQMWKSNPDRKWILTFGNNKINNIVSSILYKYQNETISKDA